MYTPEQQLLTNYAKVMVHYAIHDGKGIRKGDTIFLVGQECTKDLYLEICKEIWRAGGNVIMRYLPDEVQRYGANRALLEIGTDEQLSFFPHSYWQGVTDAMDNIMFILAEPDVHIFEGLPSDRVLRLETSRSPFMEMRKKKEYEGKLSWTLCLYGTPSMAKEAGLSLEEYWEQIITACYLRYADPVATWKHIQQQIQQVTKTLNELAVETLHIKGADVDLYVKVGAERKWLGGTGHNVPSFEVFTSPDWRGTPGSIAFNQPLYYGGKKISGIKLVFEHGIVVSASATENADALQEMIAMENADKVGEFSLTDKRHSKITKFMATTLYDENMGGEFGNTHIALGDAYRDTYRGVITEVPNEQWEEMGFNHCAKVHTDIISTTDRTVTALLKDGTMKVIYENGSFTFI